MWSTPSFLAFCCICFTAHVLPSPHDAQYTYEQVDDIHVQRGGAVDGVIQGLGYGICPAPVVADIATEYEYYDPVDDTVMDAEHKYLYQLNHYDKQQGHGECPHDLLKEGGKQGPQHHHGEGYQRGNPYCLKHQRGIVLAYHYVYYQPKGYHHQVVPGKANQGVF